MNKSIKSISVLGCGWLGLPLAIFLSKKGYHVKGSVTSKDKINELKANEIDTYVVNFQPQINQDYNEEFFNTDLLFVNIPPGRNKSNAPDYLAIIRNIIEKIKIYKITNVIYISSTSVYPDINNVVNENSMDLPNKDSGKLLINSEQLFFNDISYKTLVIRFGGLIGVNRNPARFLSGKKNITNAKAPVNLIHLDDCLHIIYELIEKQKLEGVYNACMPEHPLRKDFYIQAAKKYGLTLPEFSNEERCSYKIVDSSKLVKETNYQFIYNNPVECI